ncbi:MAG: amino acid dehydrogenase [Gammaproteobacteria bacterium]
MPNSSKTTYDKLLRYAQRLGFGDLHIKLDAKTQLYAIIAIHSTQRGPAIGGCRLVHYDSSEDAVVDALRLGYMMSLKAAVSQLPHGGAKAVIIKPRNIKDREALFSSFGQFVQELGGRYITAVDSGTTTTDMDIIARQTSYVTCTTQVFGDGDPSLYTAIGVQRGIEAAVQFKLGRDNLRGLHIAIQGAGHVGYHLAKELHAQDVRITMTDINSELLQRCVNELGVTPVTPEDIYKIPCDVFSPCALGAILNLKTIQQLQTSIVAGSANNQLAHPRYGALLYERGILYAPDFVINSGGLIHVAALYDHGDNQKATQQIYNIYNILMAMFARAQHENRPTNEIADIIALENLGVLNP